MTNQYEIQKNRHSFASTTKNNELGEPNSQHGLLNNCSQNRYLAFSTNDAYEVSLLAAYLSHTKNHE